MFLQKDVRTDPVGEKETGSEEMGQFFVFWTAVF